MSFSFGMLITLFIASVATAVSQILFKQGTNAVITNNASLTLARRFLELLMIPSFILGIFLYGSALLLWIWLLSKTSLSILYPVGLSLNVILALVAARLFLHETITPLHMLGIVIICIGIFLVAK